MVAATHSNRTRPSHSTSARLVQRTPSSALATRDPTRSVTFGLCRVRLVGFLQKFTCFYSHSPQDVHQGTARLGAQDGQQGQ